MHTILRIARALQITLSWLETQGHLLQCTELNYLKGGLLSDCATKVNQYLLHLHTFQVKFCLIHDPPKHHYPYGHLNWYVVLSVTPVNWKSDSEEESWNRIKLGHFINLLAVLNPTHKNMSWVVLYARKLAINIVSQNETFQETCWPQVQGVSRNIEHTPIVHNYWQTGHPLCSILWIW